MFPLNLVAFPFEEVNLHIFEPRYKQMIHECDHQKTNFAILPYFDKDNLQYATEMELIEIAKVYKDGKMDVRTKGVRVLKVLDFFPKQQHKLYPAGEVVPILWNYDTDFGVALAIVTLLQRLYELMQITNVSVSDPLDFKVYQNAHKMGLSDEDEMVLLGKEKELDRQKFVLEHLRRFVPAMAEAEQLRRKAALNGHFKNIKPSF